MKSFIPFIIMAICISSYFFYIKPELAIISSKQQKYTEYKNVLDKVKEIREKREALASKYGSISSDDLAKLDKMIPKEFVSEYFVNDLNALSSRYGMKISQLNLTLPVPVEGSVDQTQQSLSTITAKFTLTGTYDQLLLFLRDIESSLRIIDVMSLSVKTKGDERNNIVLDYSIEVKTYSLK